MVSFLAIGFIFTLCFVLIQFARQEYIQEEYEDVLLDVEGKLDWAVTRRIFPFGMRAQIEVTKERLDMAKTLWKQHKWDQAYSVMLQSQESMDRAQSIYSSVVTKQQKAKRELS